MIDHSSLDTKKSKINISSKKSSNYTIIRAFCYRFSQLFLIILSQLLILHFIFHSQPKSPSLHNEKTKQVIQLSSSSDHCPYGTVYVYDLPPVFNQDLLDSCHDLNPWQSRCNSVSNSGLGLKATGLSPVPKNLRSSWYWTDMFAGEVIYHSRILKHACRTLEPESATAFYIPFYAGLAVGKIGRAHV